MPALLSTMHIDAWFLTVTSFRCWSCVCTFPSLYYGGGLIHCWLNG